MLVAPAERAAMIAQLRRAADLLEAQTAAAAAEKTLWLGETRTEPAKYFPEFHATAGAGK